MATTTGPEITVPGAQGRKTSNLARRYGWPLLLYLVLTLIFSWPLALHLGDSVIRVRSGDVWQNLWNIWWVAHALFDLHTNPFHTSLLYYPDSPTLYLHALYPLAGIVSSPFQWLFGLVASFNLLVILLITLSAFCAYLLGRYLELSVGAALLAGTVFAYSPIISSQLDQGQLEQISPLWLPLFILFFLRTMRTPNFGRKFWLNCAATGFCFLLTALTTWYYALDLILFSAFAAVWFSIRGLLISPVRLVWTFRRLAGIAVLCGLFVAPLLYPTLKEASNTSYAVARNSSVLYNSADIVHFFRPGNSALWFFSQAEPEYEFQWFLGFIPLTLALFAAFTDWRKSRFWLGVALFFCMLALGPVLKIGLENYTPIDWLPTGWLQKLPLGSIVRVPIRFVTPAMLGLGMAAGFGLDSLIKKLNTGSILAKYRTRLPAALAAVALLLVFLEFYPGGRTLLELKTPAFLTQLKNEPPGAVLEMPLLKIQPIAMYDQTVHGKPIVGGYLARKPNFDFMERTPGVRELVQLGPGPEYKEFSSNDLQAVGLPTLNLYNIRYIILQLDRQWTGAEDESQARTMLAQILGNESRPVAKDGQAELYVVPKYQGGVVNAWGEATKGWYDLEGKPEDLHRWSSGEGEFTLFNPNPTPQRFRLDLSLYSYAENRVMAFWLNGQLIEQKAITPALLPASLEITLPPGRSTLGLKATGPALRPADREPGSNDKRELSFGVKGLKLSVVSNQ